MLALVRKEREEIAIGNDIVIAVLAIKGKRIIIGIKAPQEMRIDRMEVRQKAVKP